MGYLVEYYEPFMGEQPSQPDFCPSWGKPHAVHW